MPWTSSPKLMKEGLPVASYFLSGVTRVELTNYRERYGNVYLRRRSDPGAIRGEKVFVQNCVGCHGGVRPVSPVDVSGEQQSRRLASSGHPKTQGVPELSEKDRQSLIHYLDAFRAENSAQRQAALRPHPG